MGENICDLGLRKYFLDKEMYKKGTQSKTQN